LIDFLKNKSMKKLLLFCAAIFSFTSAFSQTHFYTAFGYNLGYAKLGGMNYVVDRYNETRTWLTEPMGKFSFPNGFCTSVGGSTKGFMVDVTWVGRHRIRSGSGIQPNGVVGQRDVKWRMNTFNIGFGAAIGKSHGARLNIGLSFDIGSEKTFSRVSENGVYDSEDYHLLQKNLLLGSTFFMQIIVSPVYIPGGLFIRPYFQFPYFKTNYGETSANINTATAQNDDPEQYDSYSWNAGVQLMLGLFIREK